MLEPIAEGVGGRRDAADYVLARTECEYDEQKRLVREVRYYEEVSDAVAPDDGRP